MNYVVLALMCVKISLCNGTDYRRHYGLSFYSQCGDYIKTFKCLTACKSIGYQVFRLNIACKCSCHELKTSTVLQFFKWKTNGTTMKIPKTVSPRLYDVVGTLSSPTEFNSEEIPTTTIRPSGSKKSTLSSPGTDSTSSDKADNVANTSNDARTTNMIVTGDDTQTTVTS